MPSQNTEIVQGFYQHLAKGDINAAMLPFNEQVEWLASAIPPIEGMYRGRAAITNELLMKLIATWDELRVTPRRIIDAGDDVVVLGAYHARHRVTGRVVDARLVHTWTFRQGVLTRVEQLTETGKFQQALRPASEPGLHV